MDAGDEIVMVVDEHNNIVGSAPRRLVRARNLPHRSTYVLVFNSRGELFVHKRTMTKDLFPGYYDVAAGGVVLAGESYRECARRELAEEMSIRDTPLTWHFTFYYADAHTRVWGGVFSCTYDGSIVLQAEEIDSGAFMPVADIARHAHTVPYTPDSLCLLSRYLPQTTAHRHA